MDSFLSCDWGTSSFRIRWVGTADAQIRASEQSGKGILGTFTAWKEKGHNDAERLAFYLAVIHEHIALLEEKTQTPLSGIPLLISGMASSSIGMQELPYGNMPFGVDGSGIVTERLPATVGWQRPTLLVSGVRTSTDVMRGEEIQLIGCFPDGEDPAGKKLFIFPGTHSKHIVVDGGRATGFTTYMTGEFFDLLAKKSILQVAVEQQPGSLDGTIADSFRQAVIDSGDTSLLHSCFRVRTNGLFNALSKRENSAYLSGLLIGTELRALPHAGTGMIYLCSGMALKDYYETALETLKLSDKVHTFPPEWIDEAVVRGHYKIFRKQLYE